MKKETIRLNIIRNSIGGGFYVCDPKCSFYREWATGTSECKLTKDILKAYWKNTKKPIAQCTSFTDYIK